MTLIKKENICLADKKCKEMIYFRCNKNISKIREEFFFFRIPIADALFPFFFFFIRVEQNYEYFSAASTVWNPDRNNFVKITSSYGLKMKKI